MEKIADSIGHMIFKEVEPMVQVDLPAAFTLGQVFALLSKNYLKKEPDTFTHKLMGPISLYFTCCFSPGGLFLLIGWPAWEVMYTSNWWENPFDRPIAAACYVLFMIIMVLVGVLGFYLGHKWLRKGKDKWLVVGAVIGFLLTILPFLLKWGVWMKIGTYEQVVTKAAGYYSFWKPPFFLGWLGIMSYLFLTGILMGLWLLKRDKRFLTDNPG